MTGTTIAAGEIRTTRGEYFTEAMVYPSDNEWLYAHATVPLNKKDRAYVHIVGASLGIEAARDFARAILAAADWAERQGR